MGSARGLRGRRVLLYCDGGARGNPGPAAIGAVLVDADDPGGGPLAEISETIGEATNNQAEYRAVLAGLEAAADLGAEEVHDRADSQLMIEQLRGNYKVRNAGLKPLHARALRLLGRFQGVRLEHVRRHENTAADALVNAALDGRR